MPEVLTEVTDQVAVVTLNRPERRNAISGRLLAALRTGLAEMAPAVRLAAFLAGRCTRVSLSAYQQSLLNGMDRALEARDPKLASKFAIFTRLTRDDGPPRAERLACSPGLTQRVLQMPAGVLRSSATIPIMLVAGLMAAIIALGIVTSRGGVCPPYATTMHQFAQMRAGTCEPSAHGAHK